MSKSGMEMTEQIGSIVFEGGSEVFMGRQYHVSMDDLGLSLLLTHEFFIKKAG